MTLIFSIIFLLFCASISSEKKRIAIIGTGIGGVSAAYYLLNLNKKNVTDEITVDLYERDSRIGGRVQSELLEGNVNNLGASFFIKENELIYSMIKKMNLSIVERPNAGETIGFLKKNLIQFQLGNVKLFNVLKVLWRFGLLTPFYVDSDVYTNLKKFQTIYKLLETRTTFRSVNEFLKMIDLSEEITRTIEEHLQAIGVNQVYIDEFLNALIAGIYNQDKTVNGFAGLITLIGTSLPSYEIEGGNGLIVERIFEAANATGMLKVKLNTSIKFVSKSKNNKIILNGESNEEYDYLIIACPIAKTGIRFDPKNFHIDERNESPKKFQDNFKVYIKGAFNLSYVNLQDFSELPDLLISVNITNSQGISMIRKIHPDFYLLESIHKISSEELNSMFLPEYKVVKNFQWIYPILSKVADHDDLPDFILEENIYHVNAIEILASCMELSMISAKNIVNMIEQKLIQGSQGMIEQVEVKEAKRDL